MASPTSGLTLLVVDDSATSCAVIEKQLTKLGCHVVVANDGVQALAAITTTRFDLVLLDCFMPVMDGFMVAQSIRQQEQLDGGRHLPVIGISGDTDDAHAQLCLDSGMDGVLPKPLPNEELETILALWCASPSTGMTMADVKTVDLPALFRSTSREDYVLLIEAINAGDMVAVKRLAHRMKGAALTMKDDAMVVTLKRLETNAVSPTSNAVLQEDMAVLLQHIDAL